MLDRVKFTETLEAVSEIIRTSTEPMSEEEILSYFSDMELTQEHKDMVVAYYQNPQPEVQQAQEDEDMEEAEQQGEKEITVAQKALAARESEEDSRILKMYLEEIALLPSYSKEQEKALYQRLADGDETAVKELSDCWLARVLELAREHNSKKAVLEDIIQEGNIGLFLMLQELLGCGKITSMEDAISKAVEEAMWAFVAESDEEKDGDHTVLGKVTLLQEAKKLLEENLEREATLEEMANYTKLDLEELQEILLLVEKAEKK